MDQTQSHQGAADGPEVGSTAHDIVRDKIGRVMDHVRGLIYLRPLGGGKEWCARPGDVEQVAVSESLRPAVNEANRRSREGM